MKRSTTTGGPYTTISSPTTTSYTNTGLTNGTPYYYVVSAVNSAGESANSSEVTATPVAPPAAPTGLQAVAGNGQVVLSWTASASATSYHVKRGAATGGPYTQVAAPAASPYTDTGLTNGTHYYYVVSAINAGGESANSAEATATPNASTSVTVNIDTLSNRHPISPYVYGGAYPKDAPTITDSGMTVVRWGGDATSRYNWKTQTYNAGNDWYFSDYMIGEIGTSDSAQFITDVINAKSNPLMTMVMLDWVSKADQTNADGRLHSFSVATYGPQCHHDPYDLDAGNGVKSDCSTNITGNDPNDANTPLIDDPTSTCPSNSKSPCTLYRSEWAAALATAFGTAPHFYDMDNEPEIWGGTHRDIHPTPSSYDELRDTYLRVATKLKTWDPLAIRLGPITCCWWFYWNGADSNDRLAHASQDFFPWWLNEVYWRDQISGTPSVEVVDVHAYPEPPDISSYTPAQKQALTARIYREYWDPTYTSESGSVNQVYTTYIQPNHAIAFRVPRLRALINTNYPGLPLSITEWSAEFAGDTQAARDADFSTAIGDADAYGILGRERVYLASRWGAPDPANPNYQALKLYANYDGAHHMFGSTSVSATHNADPNLFSVYAAVGPAATPLTIMVVNKDPGNAANVTFNLPNFTAGSYTAYTLSQSSPNAIVTSAGAGIGSLTFAPYSVTLLVVTGAPHSVPAAEWDLNPDVIMVPAGGAVTLNPCITSAKSGNTTVTLSAPTIDSGGGTITIPTPLVTQTPLTGHGVINVATGTTPGFYHFTVTGTDSTNNVAQKQGGWILVGNLPATLAKTTDPQKGNANSQITLAVTFNPGASQGVAPGAPTAAGATIRFTTDAGTLSGGTYGSTTSQLATTNATGVASITLTLPSTAGPVHVTAEGPFQLGHPVATFTETAQ